MEANIFDIQRASTVDGPGIRTTVFFKGCNLKCKWCHNPESQSFKKQMLLYSSKCTGCGKCIEKCPVGCALPYEKEKCNLCGKCELFCPVDARKICGEEKNCDEIISIVCRDKAFYENSGGGVTFSGGECMLQPDALLYLLKECKNNGISTAVDTAGFVPWESFEKVLPYTDLFLFDIKCFDEKKHIEGTGVSNRKILENFRKLCENDADILVRIPVISGFNAHEDEMKAISDFIKSCSCKVKVELLPYHKMGEHKYSACGLEAVTFSEPSTDEMDKYRSCFE